MLIPFIVGATALSGALGNGKKKTALCDFHDMSDDSNKEDVIMCNETNTKNSEGLNQFCAANASNVYDASVGARALERAGHCPQLKGIAHEIMFCDKFNTDPRNLAKGWHMNLTKSTTAGMKDFIVTDRAGHVVAHGQLKDTTSIAGIRKTVEQILDGHYCKTRVFGTDETTEAVNEALKRAGANPRMKSTGISSADTTRIADKALGNMPSFSTCLSAAKTGGVVGAAFGAGIEAVSSILDGNKSMEETCEDVAVAAIQGGAVGAASGVIGAAASGVTGAAVSAAAGTSVGAAVLGTGVGAAIAGAAPLVASVAAPAVVLGACEESTLDLASDAVDVVADGVMSAFDLMDDVGDFISDFFD